MRPKRSLHCSICDRDFSVYKTWYSHQKQIHGKPYIPCRHCTELFKTIGLRNAHYYRSVFGTRESAWYE